MITPSPSSIERWAWPPTSGIEGWPPRCSHPLPLVALTARAAQRWRALLDGYGLDWCWSTIERWIKPTDRWSPRAPRPAGLAELSRALSSGGDAPARTLAGKLVGARWTDLDRTLDALTELAPTTTGLRGLRGQARAIVDVLAGAAIVGNDKLQRTVVARLTAASGYPIEAAVEVLRVPGRRGGRRARRGPTSRRCATTSSASSTGAAPARRAPPTTGRSRRRSAAAARCARS